MYICVTFPVADYRSLHQNSAGRLEIPAWGAIDPRASFARGFGSIHTRTGSGNGYAGENYYADCNNLVRYPKPVYLKIQNQEGTSLLLFPVYRRFYFDGLMSGRFELGFRTTVESLKTGLEPAGLSVYQINDIAKQVLQQHVEIRLQDSRVVKCSLMKAMLALRDGWILSSTKLSELATYDIETVGSVYVGVGRPFVFCRANSNEKVSLSARSRSIFEDDHFSVRSTSSGAQESSLDVTILLSKPEVADKKVALFEDHESVGPKPSEESSRERLTRLFHSQIRTLTYAHSFYVLQSKQGHFHSSGRLNLAIGEMLERFKGLEPLVDDKSDALTCLEMKEILKNADVNVVRMAEEIEAQIQKSWVGRKLGGLFGYLDSKADVAIEAAASTATKHVLSSGP